MNGRRQLLGTKPEIVNRMRRLRDSWRAHSPRVRAHDLATSIFDSYAFTANLRDVLLIMALEEMARDMVQDERHRQRNQHRQSAAAVGDGFTIQEEFPEFADICAACPNNYALPGDDDLSDTEYVETFDVDHEWLPAGFKYLRKHGEGALRNAEALERLWRLCQRLGGRPGETPREILRRAGFAAE